MTAYNRRFGKAPRHDFDVHRPLETDDDLTAFFTWREPRRVSKSLTVQYDKVLYLIEDNELSRRAIGKYIEVWHYPDGRKELRLNGVVLPYSTYDRLQKIDQGAIVDNKRLGRTLEFIKLGVGVIPWSPMARGRLTRDWSVTSRRTQNDAFALKMYENAALLDKPVIDVVASIAEKHAVPRAHVAIAWLLSKSVITAPIIGATKPEHLSTAISALDFSLSDAEITELEARYLPHPVDGIIPPLPDTPPSLTPPSAIQNY